MENKIVNLHEEIYRFSCNVCGVIKDLTDLDYSIVDQSLSENPFTSGRGSIVFIHFAGVLQGFYFLLCEEQVTDTLLYLVNGAKESQAWEHQLEDIKDVFGEILNIAVGKSLSELETKTGVLSYNSAMFVMGDIFLPSLVSRSLTISGTAGDIRCVLSINSAGLKIAQKLLKTEKDLELVSQKASIDSLTGLYNRAYFDSIFPQLCEKAHQFDTPLTMMVIDFDDFKTINDTHGHQTGDLCLRTLSKSLRSSVRHTDVCIRFGGDEFLILLPRTALEGAERIGESIRTRLANEVIGVGSKNICITISVGIAQITIGETASDFFRRADMHLYAAKSAGKNRIVSKI